MVGFNGAMWKYIPVYEWYMIAAWPLCTFRWLCFFPPWLKHFSQPKWIPFACNLITSVTRNWSLYIMKPLEGDASFPVVCIWYGTFSFISEHLTRRPCKHAAVTSLDEVIPYRADVKGRCIGLLWELRIILPLCWITLWEPRIRPPAEFFLWQSDLMAGLIWRRNLKLHLHTQSNTFKFEWFPYI